MPSSFPASAPQRRALRLVATILAGLVVLFVANTARSSSQESASPLDTQSLLTIPAFNQPQPTAVATTAPVELPTSTPAPPPTATAIPTVDPTATAVPTAVPTTVPTATAVVAMPEPQPAAQAQAAVSVADAGSTAESADVGPQPEATPTAEPEPTATVEATATPLPDSSETADSADETPEPTPEPTATPTPTPTPIPLQTAEQLEAYVLGEINGVRARAGLGPLAIDQTISAISRDWSQQMAVGGFFEHRPSDQLNVMLPAGWRQWGENIASAPDIFWAQSSLESSPGHYANMVGPFTHIGIGVYTTGTQVWVTHNFVLYE